MPCQPPGMVEPRSLRHAVFAGFAIRALVEQVFLAKRWLFSVRLGTFFGDCFPNSAYRASSPFTTSFGIPIVFRALMAKPARTACRSDWFQPPLEVSPARSLSDHSVITL